MPARPAADVGITEDLVRRLLRRQHPDLADLPLHGRTEGWDNVLVRVGDTRAVRLPRRRLSAGHPLHEQRWLPALARRLPVPVPAPVRTGRPSDGYPFPWTVVPWFPGTSAALLDPARRTPWAQDLADVVGRLHTPAPRDAPANPWRGGPLLERDPAVRDRLSRRAVPRASEVAEAWTRALAQPGWTEAPRWLHGDLHPANLVTQRDALVAVVDFGDLTAGDPATDLATAWLTFDAEGRRRFRARLTERTRVDPATWARARGWAIVLATALVAHADDEPALGTVGVHALTQILDDPDG